MAYNFKSIADVDVVANPTESANILIEENGFIKKAPKTAVGCGLGGSLMVNFLYDGNGDEYCDRSFDEIKEVLTNGGVVLASRCKYGFQEEGQFAAWQVCNNAWPLYFAELIQDGQNLPGEWIVFVSTISQDRIPILSSNNQFEYLSNEAPS